MYDFAHIGNFRAFLTYDLIKRWLLYLGYEVDHICNLTDVDDKIIVKMQKDGQTLKQVTEKYSQAFFDDLQALNIIKANQYPKATEYIKEIEQMVKKLIENGNAYEENGSVYYKVSSFPSYGQLAHLQAEDSEEGNTRQLETGAGGSGPNERRGNQDKEDNRDFALWKAYTPQDGDVVWDSAFGRGRPGPCYILRQFSLNRFLKAHSPLMINRLAYRM